MRSKTRSTAPGTRAKARPGEARPRKARGGTSGASQPLREQARGQARDVYRVAILEAAERVFAKRGFVETKVADIAREAGLAAGTLYNYFDSKDAIYQSICALRGEEALTQVRAIADSGAPALDRLRRMIEWALEHLEANAEKFLLHVQMRSALEWEMKQMHGEAAHANYLEHLAILERVASDAQKAGTLRKDVPARDLAGTLAGITNGFIHAWLMAKPRPRLAARAPLIFDLFCKGAAN